MDIAADLARIDLQEQRLVLQHLDLDVVWRIGARLVEIGRQRRQPLVIEVRLARETVFFAAMQGVAPINADWVRRKRNTTELMQRSSLHVGLALQQRGLSLQDPMALPERDHARHGGSFPLRVAAAGCIGAVTVSGAPDRDDHAMVVQALAELCAVPLGDVALD